MYIERTDAQFVNTPKQILTEKPRAVALYDSSASSRSQWEDPLLGKKKP